jgi:hypothetical protein
MINRFGDQREGFEIGILVNKETTSKLKDLDHQGVFQVL